MTMGNIMIIIITIIAIYMIYKKSIIVCIANKDSLSCHRCLQRLDKSLYNCTGYTDLIVP